MDTETFEKKSCLDKKRFLSRSEARGKKRLTAKLYARKMRIYICDFCGFFHLTTVKKEKK